MKVKQNREVLIFRCPIYLIEKKVFWVKLNHLFRKVVGFAIKQNSAEK